MLTQIVQSAKYHLKWRRLYRREFAGIPDREVYDGEILPQFAAEASMRDLLDIGCEWYSLHHHRWFRRHRHTTIDIEPSHAAFGARRHVVGSALELERYFTADSFDLVLANGLIGWGVVDDRDLIQLASGLHRVMREGAVLALGWNDCEGKRPETPVPDLFGERAGFAPWELPTRGCSQFVANPENSHRFLFVRKVGTRA